MIIASGIWGRHGCARKWQDERCKHLQVFTGLHDFSPVLLYYSSMSKRYVPGSALAAAALLRTDNGKRTLRASNLAYMTNLYALDLHITIDPPAWLGQTADQFLVRLGGLVFLAILTIYLLAQRQRSFKAAGLSILAMVGIGLWMASKQTDKPSPPAAKPEPTKRRPRAPENALVMIEGGFGTHHGPGGLQPQIDYPDSEWFRNIGSKLDGAGECVFTSAEFMLLWAGLEKFRGFRDWCAQNYAGGGYPAKLSKLIGAYCKAKNIPPEYFDVNKDLFQYEGSDFDGLEAVLRTDRLCGCTLYHSQRYGGGTIYHCVNAAHLTKTQGAFMDNNRMGKDAPNIAPYEWHDRAGFERAAKLSGKVWYFWIRQPGAFPPPSPNTH